MTKLSVLCLAAGFLITSAVLAQTSSPTAAKAASDRVIGTITAIDPAAHTVTVKEDKTGTTYKVDLQNTKKLVKVDPTAKDLSNATDITAGDLAVNDRVQVTGSKDSGDAFEARNLVLMSARELQKVHQMETAEWQKSTNGTVTAIDAANNKVTINVKAADGMKPTVVDLSKTSELTRFSPDTPNTPVPSKIADIRTGDLLRVIGTKSDDGSTIAAQKAYSGAFRTLGGTVASIAPDGKFLNLKVAGTNKMVQINLDDQSAIRKLTPEAATMLAMRLNPNYRPDTGAAGGRGGRGGQGGFGGGQGGGNGQAGGGQGQSGGDQASGGQGGYGRQGGYGQGGGQGQGGNGGDNSANAQGTQGGSPGMQGGQGGQSGPGGQGFGGRQGTAGGPGMTGGGRGFGGRGRGGATDPSQIITNSPKIAVTDLKNNDVVIVSGVSTTPDDTRILATDVVAGAEPILRASPSSQGSGPSFGDLSGAFGGGGDGGGGGGAE